MNERAGWAIVVGFIVFAPQCKTSTATLNSQSAASARVGDLLVYKSLDGGWMRGVVRGSICDDESVLRQNGTPYKQDPAVDCGPDAGR